MGDVYGPPAPNEEEEYSRIMGAGRNFFDILTQGLDFSALGGNVHVFQSQPEITVNENPVEDFDLSSYLAGRDNVEVYRSESEPQVIEVKPGDDVDFEGLFGGRNFFDGSFLDAFNSQH